MNSGIAADSSPGKKHRRTMPLGIYTMTILWLGRVLACGLSAPSAMEGRNGNASTAPFARRKERQDHFMRSPAFESLLPCGPQIAGDCESMCHPPLALDQDVMSGWLRLTAWRLRRPADRVYAPMISNSMGWGSPAWPPGHPEWAPEQDFSHSDASPM